MTAPARCMCLRLPASPAGLSCLLPLSLSFLQNLTLVDLSERGSAGLVSGAAQREMPHERGFRPDIQGLRALAVGMVVVYHLYPRCSPAASPAWTSSS